MKMSQACPGALTCLHSSGASPLPPVPKIPSLGSSRHWLFPRREVPPGGCCTSFTVLHWPKPPDPPQQWGTLPGGHHHRSSRSPLPGPCSPDPGAGEPGELRPADGSQDDRFPEALAGRFPHPLMEQIPGWRSICPSTWRQEQLAVPAGSSDPGICRKLPWIVPRIQPRANLPTVREELQEQQQPPTIASSPSATTSSWVNPWESRAAIPVLSPSTNVEEGAPVKHLGAAAQGRGKHNPCEPRGIHPAML